MRLLIPTIIAAMTFAGCGGSGGSSQPLSAAHTVPHSYAEATTAAVIAAPPAAPGSCEPVKVIGSPGTVVALHSATGSMDYTADASGNFTSATGESLTLLVPPSTTLWFTIVGQPHAAVSGTGAEFLSTDDMGATWTAPSVAHSTDPQTVIHVMVLAAPSSNG